MLQFGAGKAPKIQVQGFALAPWENHNAPSFGRRPWQVRLG